MLAGEKPGLSNQRLIQSTSIFHRRLEQELQIRPSYDPRECTSPSQHQRKLMNMLHGRGVKFVSEPEFFTIINRFSELHTNWSCDMLVAIDNKLVVIEVDEWAHTTDIYHTLRVNDCLTNCGIHFLRIQLPNLKHKTSAFKLSLNRMIAGELAECLRTLKKQEFEIEPLKPIPNEVSDYTSEITSSMLRELNIEFFRDFRLPQSGVNSFNVDFYLPVQRLAINIYPAHKLTAHNLLWILEQNNQISNLVPLWPIDLHGFRWDEARYEKSTKLAIKWRILNGLEKIKNFDYARFENESESFRLNFGCPLLNKLYFSGSKTKAKLTVCNI
ncbi:MAG: hypothetical protein OHK0017_03040 [Patescibacteria group bacterium]